jgi:hypothetical protein
LNADPLLKMLHAVAQSRQYKKEGMLQLTIEQLLTVDTASLALRNGFPVALAQIEDRARGIRGCPARLVHISDVHFFIETMCIEIIVVDQCIYLDEKI